MKNNTQFIPGFHPQSLRRKPRSSAQKLSEQAQKVRQHSLLKLSECFSRFIPASAFEQGKTGAFSRRRLFSKENTFWTFFSQVLNADNG